MIQFQKKPIEKKKYQFNRNTYNNSFIKSKYNRAKLMLSDFPITALFIETRLKDARFYLVNLSIEKLFR